MQWFNRHETVGLLLSPGFDVSYCVLVTLPSGFTKGITCSNMYGEAGGGEGDLRRGCGDVGRGQVEGWTDAASTAGTGEGIL